MKKRGDKKFCLREQYKLSWDYIKESRRYIYFVIGLFFVFALIGYFVETPKVIEEQILKVIQELLAKTEGMNQLQLTNFIFWNNLQSGFIGLVFGVVVGIVPFIVSVFNGYLLGFVAKIVIAEEGVLILWKLLPHGIFELPAIWISFGLGLKFGSFLFQDKIGASFKKFLWEGLRVFVFVIFPLLLIAALIEGWLIAVVG